MRSEIRKAALDAILERIRRERYQNHGGFAKQAAIWFAKREKDGFDKESFIADFRLGVDFHRFNEVSDRDAFLGAVYEDVVKVVKTVPTSEPRKLYVDDIDSFSHVSEIKAQDVDVDVLQDISEAEVKTCLREIIGEHFDQPDWGGELNDLFTSRVRVDGQRVDSAFMLKGPSINSPMQIRDAGTRGDQIQRLFQSGAELFVVQFNGKIEDRTIQHIKDLAKAYDAPKFCIIDGTDTARLLKAYNKL